MSSPTLATVHCTPASAAARRSRSASSRLCSPSWWASSSRCVAKRALASVTTAPGSTGSTGELTGACGGAGRLVTALTVRTRGRAHGRLPKLRKADHHWPRSRWVPGRRRRRIPLAPEQERYGEPGLLGGQDRAAGASGVDRGRGPGAVRAGVLPACAGCSKSSASGCHFRGDGGRRGSFTSSASRSMLQRR